MRASESSFESYKSKRILPNSFSEKKLQTIFEIRFKKYGVIIVKSLPEEQYLEISDSQDVFLLFNSQTSYCPNMRTNEQYPKWFGRSLTGSWKIRQLIMFQNSWYCLIASSKSSFNTGFWASSVWTGSAISLGHKPHVLSCSESIQLP